MDLASAVNLPIIFYSSNNLGSQSIVFTVALNGALVFYSGQSSLNYVDASSKINSVLFVFIKF